MDLIKTFIFELFKMLSDYNELKLMKNNYFKMNKVFDILKKVYQIDINLSDLFYINNHFNINDLKYKKDLNNMDINLLNLYDLKYLNRDYYFTVRLITIDNNKSIKKGKTTFIVLSYKGGDKKYNIILFKNKFDVILFNNYINKRQKIQKSKLKTFYKKNKYNYKKCKKYSIRKNEYDLIKGKKYSHNFKQKTTTNNKLNDMDKTYYLLDLIINCYYTVSDVIDIYINSYNINDNIVNIDIIKERLINNMEKQYKTYLSTNKDKYYVTFKFMLNNLKVINELKHDLIYYKDILDNSDLFNQKTTINDYL